MEIDIGVWIAFGHSSQASDGLADLFQEALSFAQALAAKRRRRGKVCGHSRSLVSVAAGDCIFYARRGTAQIRCLLQLGWSHADTHLRTNPCLWIRNCTGHFPRNPCHIRFLSALAYFVALSVKRPLV